MKLTKKLLACILAMACCLGQFTCICMADGATAGEPTVVTDISTVEGLDQLLLSDSNITLGYTRDFKGVAGSYGINYTQGENLNHNTSASSDIICDGSYATHTDINAIKSYDTVTQEPIEGYLDLSFSFPGSGAEVTNFFYHGVTTANETLYTAEYGVFAANDLGSLYNSDNEIYHFVNTAPYSAAQYVTFPEVVGAKYFGVRIYKCVTAYHDYSNARIAEIAFFGSCDTPDYSAYTDGTKLADAKAALGGDTDLTHGYATSNSVSKGTALIECTEYGVKSESKGSFYSDGTTTAGYSNNIFDGLTSSAADINVHNNGKQFHFLDEILNYKPNSYVDITIALRYTADINQVFISQRSAKALRSYEYEIYTSDSYETLYTAANRRFYYENISNSQEQVFELAEPVSASFVGIRILKGVTQEFTYGYAASYARLAEIAVLGEYNDPNYAYDSVIDPANTAACVSQLKSDYNLMQSGYTLGKVDRPSHVIITGKDNGTALSSFGSFYSYNHGTANNAVFDGKLESNADVNVTAANGHPMFTVNEDRSAKEDTYIDISICLTYAAKVDKVFIANRATAALMTHEYAIFTSNSLDTLYNEENKKYHYINTLKAQYQTIEIADEVTEKYVGIRIYQAVESPFTGYEVSAAYPRFEEIAVFGKYDLEYFDYTVNANIENVISVFENTYHGKAKQYSVPLVSGNKIFKDWQINGNPAECDINQYDGTATIEFTVDKPIAALAIYEDLPTTLESSKYAINTEKALVRVPVNEIFYTASVGFNVYRGSIVAKNGEEQLFDGDYIIPGTKLSIDNVPDSELTVIIQSDYDLNGSVEVTDIVSAIDGVYAGNHQEDAMFAFDANDSGKITVSDIVVARKNILNNVRYDLSEKNVAVPNLQYKTMGRTATDEDGSLYLDLTASGFSFNAYCYGDVSVELSKATWFTVIVDGEEKDMLLGGSGKQTAVIAEDLHAGEHFIELYKQSEGDSSVNIYSVTLQGEILEAPKNADLLIEFAGDSITCGYGNVVDKEAVGGNRSTDGYKSYGAQTARLLSADWSNVSKSGAALIHIDGMTNDHIPTVYKQQTFLKTDAYNFTRKADIVVINLGTNDSGLMSGWTIEQRKSTFYAAAREFVEYILEVNGADTKIVFAFGMMTAVNEFDEVYIQLAAELQSEGTDAFYCRLPTNKDGAVDHPSVEGDLAAAEVLAEFIKTEVL